MKKGTFLFTVLCIATALLASAFNQAPSKPGKVVWTQVVHMDAEQANSTSESKGLVIFRLTSDMVLTYKVIVQKQDEGDMMTAFHIHFGAVGVNGGAAVDLSPGVINLGHFQSIKLTSQQYNTLFNENEALYVNVHSQLYPSGSIRGQIR